MIALSKSQSHLTSKVKYRYLIIGIFASLVLCVTYSNESFAQNHSSRSVRRSSLNTTAIKGRRDNFNAQQAKHVDSLGKEIASERSTYVKQNVSNNLCKKMHDIKCEENKLTHEMQLTRRKASALQRLRRRIMMQFPENSEVKQQKTIKKQGTFLQKPPGRTRSKHNRNKRAATSEKSRLWEHATIPYVFDTMFSGDDKLKIMLTMSIWENATCVIFKEKEATDQDYFVFTDKNCGCCADVGRKEQGVSSVSLAKECMNIGIILHELGHTIGFWHEHSRPDRDQYVNVSLGNVIEDKTDNFKKMKPEEVDSLGEQYDFDSIMHYGPNKWARNAYQDTILPKRLPGSVVRPKIGQRYYLSPGDIRQTNKLYNCATCGWTLQKATATFSHKPTAGKSETCHWRIQVSLGERIVLNITALGIPGSSNCVNGHLEVRDGPNSQSPLLGRFCGKNLPGPLKSSGRRMWLEYKTLSGAGSGFTARYVTECGGGISSGEGVLASPTYNDKYLPNLDCSWNITVEPGYKITLNFEDFELEKDSICEYDYLEIRDENNKTDPLIGKYCGLNYPKMLNSTANQLFVRFVSDSATERKGFYISFVQEIDECKNNIHKCDQVCVNTIGGYKCECYVGFELKYDGRSCEKTCGGVINTTNGDISSPFYPDKYPADKTCEWIINAPKNHKIVLTFLHFELEKMEGKSVFDFVKVYPEIGAKPEKNIVLCGDSIPEPITSKGNMMKIVFQSDVDTQFSGFSAVFCLH